MSEKYDFKALEIHLKNTLILCDEKARVEVEKAINMLPRYKQIEQALEMIKQALINSSSFTVDAEQGVFKVDSVGGYAEYIPTGKKTITIELVK